MAKEKEQKNKCRLKKSHLALIVMLIILIASFYYVFIIRRPLETKTIEVKFMIGDKMGFDVDTELLTFGRIIRSSSVKRYINAGNNYEFPVELRVLASSNLINFLYADSPVYIINPGESLQIPLTLSVPGNAELGNYSGQVKLEFRKK